MPTSRVAQTARSLHVSKPTTVTKSHRIATRAGRFRTLTKASVNTEFATFMCTEKKGVEGPAGVAPQSAMGEFIPLDPTTISRSFMKSTGRAPCLAR